MIFYASLIFQNPPEILSVPKFRAKIQSVIYTTSQCKEQEQKQSCQASANPRKKKSSSNVSVRVSKFSPGK
jgi:hypothetical protein